MSAACAAGLFFFYKYKTYGTYRITIKINPPEAAKVANLPTKKCHGDKTYACDTCPDLLIELMQPL